MMQRILQLDDETLDKYELPSLRVTAASGSALPGELATKWMDRFGDNLYNLYGSTEVAWATIATPEDLRAAPGTAGRPPRGTVVRIVDQEGKDVPPGETGRIFVGNEMAFEGYTGGGGKEELEGLLSSGDVGHFDEDGRLFIDGRDDEMIVSGGENVFPREVEDLLADHDAVKEVAVIGVDDEEFGQRLKAFVVLGEGGALDEDELKALREVEPRPLQGPARGRVPRLAAPQRDRQGPQARAGLSRGGAARAGPRPRPWLDERPPAAERAGRLERDLEVEVAVIGGGIVGLSAALQLQRAGVRVVVLEGRRVGAGSDRQHDREAELAARAHLRALAATRGDEAARAYAEANECGLATDRDARRRARDRLRPAAQAELHLHRGPRRARASSRTRSRPRHAAGLPARSPTETDLPFEVAAAVRLDDQAEFHPVKYLARARRGARRRRARVSRAHPGGRASPAAGC